MYTLRQTERFSGWLHGLRDPVGRARILARVERLAAGHVGDAKHVGEGVQELRIHVGPGYRVYFMQVGSTVVLLLSGGDKGTQARDIRAAIALSKEV